MPAEATRRSGSGDIWQERTRRRDSRWRPGDIWQARARRDEFERTGARFWPRLPSVAQRELIGRLERFESVDSTQTIVREWLERGIPEVAVAVAEHQRHGRGRQGRAWVAPPGAALLLSVGLRPARLSLAHGWRLGATLSLAMLDAAEEAAGLRDDSLWLKWPNDIVAEAPDGRLVKVAGVLGETVGGGQYIESAVVGIGINTDWPAADFPPDLAPSMSSLREVAGGRPIDNEQLLDAFLARLEPRYEALRAGLFDAGGWSRRQITTGRQIELDVTSARLTGTAVGVDPERGALLLATPDGETRPIDTGEVVHCRVIAHLSKRRPSASG